MNERIKQLWEDSDEIKVRYPEQGSPVSVSEQTLEKFAELIMRECIAQCWAVSELESNGYVVSECSKKIRKHFGVE
jgi:hypothetical protein